MRDLCLRCRKAASTCYCAQLQPFEPGVGFAILIHPKETRKSIGTGRMAHRSLLGSYLIDGLDFTQDPRVKALIEDPTLFPVVLYPGAQSLDLTRAAREDARAFFPEGRKPLIFVIDATWPSAKKMIRLSENLRALPQIRFTPPAPSEYSRIRQEPREDYCSTLEAAHEVIDRLSALGIVPSGEGRPHDQMLNVFRAMVDAQSRRSPKDDPRSPGSARA